MYISLLLFLENWAPIELTINQNSHIPSSGLHSCLLSPSPWVYPGLNHPGAESSITVLCRNCFAQKKAKSYIKDISSLFYTEQIWWKDLPKLWDEREWNFLWEFCTTDPCKLSIPVSCCFQIFVDELMLPHHYPDICNSIPPHLSLFSFLKKYIKQRYFF